MLIAPKLFCGKVDKNDSVYDNKFHITANYMKCLPTTTIRT